MKNRVRLLPVPFSHPPRVLVIDDSAIVRHCFKICLQQIGAVVTCLGEAPRTELDVLLTSPRMDHPDIIFVDLILPEIDGFTLIRLLKQSPRFKQVPLIVLSRRNGMRDRLFARLAGAQAYVVKPITQEHILALVRRYLPTDHDAWLR